MLDQGQQLYVAMESQNLITQRLQNAKWNHSWIPT